MIHNQGSNELELKYIINNNYANQIAEFLNTSCIQDSDYPSGIVSSIYYDTLDWKFLREKVNSDYLKTKIRVRWYTDSLQKHSQYSFIEAKYKIGNRRKKIRKRTKYTGSYLANTELSSNELLDIPFLLKSEGTLLKNPIYPVFEVQYKRQRFVDPYSSSRICIDYDISSPRSNYQLLPKVNPFNLRTAVFELKGNLLDLPPYLKPLIDMGCRKSCFSKYYSCYEKMSGFNV